MPGLGKLIAVFTGACLVTPAFGGCFHALVGMPIPAQQEAREAYDLGMRLLREKRYQEALEQFKSLERDSPQLPQGYTGEGIALALMGKQEESIEALKKALDVDHTFWVARRELGIVYWQTNQKAQAAKELGNIVKLFPDDPAVNLLLGQYEFERANYPQASAYLGKAHVQVAADVRLSLMAAEAQLKSGLKAPAREALEALAASPALSPQQRYHLGWLLGEAGDYASSIHVLKSLPDDYADQFGRSYAIALAYYEDGQYANCIGTLSDLKNRKILRPELFSLLGVAEENGHHTLEAYDAFREGIYAFPTDDQNYLNIAALSVEHLNYELATQILTSGIGLMPSDYKLYLARGVIYTGGRVKQFKVVNRSPGLRLGVAHFGDWPKHGSRQLEYDVVLGSFNGDWYDAGEIYRTWSLQQEWATPLHRRKDVPAWLLDSPVYVTIHPEWDRDLSKPIVIRKEFLPFEKCIPLLQGIADRVQAPVAAILMGWEKTGSWSYPDSVPWLGGEDALKSFVSTVRQRGWHVGTFCNGSRWVFGHKSSGYDGSRFFKEHGGMESVCRTPKGDPVLESWEAGFRKSYECCLGSPLTRQIAVDYVNRMIGWGFESLQFFDQNNGASTFPCYASAHEHSPVPGKWMTEKMEEIMTEFRRAASEAGALAVAHSSESGINEYCLSLFQETEFRMWPPGHGTGDDIPLYQFLFHECIVIQGMMGWAPEPYHMQIKNAANCVWGAIPGGVLTGDGTFLNKDTPHFAPWEPKVGSNEDALEMIRTVTALRRGPGKDFLVFGRMLKPAAVNGIQMMEWAYEGRQHRLPSVFHAAWQAPNGRFGIVLANWTTEKQTVVIKDTRLPGTKTGSAVVLHTSDRALRAGPLHGEAGHRTVALAPLSCALIEVTAV